MTEGTDVNMTSQVDCLNPYLFNQKITSVQQRAVSSKSQPLAECHYPLIALIARITTKAPFISKKIFLHGLINVSVILHTVIQDIQKTFKVSFSIVVKILIVLIGIIKPL